MCCHRAGRYLTIAIALMIAGCSGGGSPPVTGKVLLDGSPLADADLEFEKRDKEGVNTFTAKTDAEGKFQVPSIPGRKTPPGNYTVLITKWVDKKGKPTPPEEIEMLKASGQAKNIVPPKYSDAAFTPVKVDIKDGANELPPIELKSK